MSQQWREEGAPLFSTVWKIDNFSVTQILREIIFGESRRSKTAVFAILGLRKWLIWYISAFKKSQNS